jgi:hypothetical protein
MARHRKIEDGLLRRFTPRNDIGVVPAQAGTHTPRPRGLARWLTAFAPRNACDYGSPRARGRRGSESHLRVLAAPCVRVLPVVCASERSEGAGNAGRAMRPQPRMQNKKAYEHSPTVTPASPGIPRAMVLTVSFVLSPVIGLSCHRRQRNCFRKLDASVEASGPHDFAVRLTCCSSKAPLASTASRPAFVTIASRPLWDETARFIVLIWVKRRKEFFANGTGQGKSC